jgi:hypothetical protein
VLSHSLTRWLVILAVVVVCALTGAFVLGEFG